MEEIPTNVNAARVEPFDGPASDRADARCAAVAAAAPVNALFAFEEREAALQAVRRLTDGGLPAESIRFSAREADPNDDGRAAIDEQITGGLLTNLSNLFQGIFDWGSSPHDASPYEETVRRGGAVLSVDADSDAQRVGVERAMQDAACTQRTEWRRG